MNKAMRPLAKSRRGGFALVITLITIVLLTIMAVAFLASSSLDQTTARAFASQGTAQLAARTAVNAAIARLTDNFSTYSDSATSWEKVNSGGNLRFEGTTLYYRDKSPDDATAGGALATLHALPLISGAVPVAIPAPPESPTAREATLAGAFPANLDNTNSFDLNHARSATDTQGEIGAASGAAARPEFRGQWIDQTDADGKVTARYAYWMEDESFKANVNLMGVTPRGSTTMGDSPSQVPLQGLFKALGVTDFDGMANAIYNSRASFPGSKFFEYPAIDQASPTTIADTAKFESTIFSGALNLSRTGTKRINLNKIVADSTDPVAIRSQLDQIIKAITYQAPNFAQRFYRTGSDKNSLDVPDTGTPSDRAIYLNKIAANIRDYIDTDSQPTIVNNDTGLTVNIGAAPQHSLPGGGASGDNEVVAIGKEAVPFLNEYMLRVKQIEFTPTATNAQYKIEIDHYLEFWNMTTKTITLNDLGPQPFVRIANQFAWDATGSSPIHGDDIPEDPSRDFTVPLSAFKDADNNPVEFRPGTATVLTTDPASLPAEFNVENSLVFRPTAGVPADAFRVFQGTTYKKSSGNDYQLTSEMRPKINGSDSSTELILGNDNGVIDSFGAPSVADMSVDVSKAEKMDPSKWHFRDSSLAGTIGTTYDPATPSQPGDPRTTNEQMTLSIASDDDHTRYISRLSSSTVPGKATITTLNASTVDPSQWPDPSADTTQPIHATAAYAPAVIANAQLTSIGELGNVFDPTRLVGVSGDVRHSRGGGRTLRIGQPDRYDATTNPTGLWDGDSNSASREWVSWRLADIFSTNDAVQLDGRVNVNGVNRDGGAALKAALYGYAFQPSPLSDPQIDGTTLSDPAIQTLLDQLGARLTNDATTYPQFSATSGPLFERGELSELPLFNSGTDLTGVGMATVYDRGREELSRRLTELTTTRGNIFTVYAVGQSLIPPPAGSSNPPTVTATSQVKITFRIDPQWAGGTPPSDPFDPTQTVRFNKPDSYAIKILYVGS